jgi:hypothetical protein
MSNVRHLRDSLSSRSMVHLLKYGAVLSLFLCAVADCAAAGYKPPEIVIQHMSTAFAGQGMCAVRFSVETSMGDGDAGNVTLNLLFLDKNNKTIARGELSTELTDSTAGRYQEPTLEGQEFCLSADTRVVIARAKSEHGGKKYDLLKLKKVRASEFKPYPIAIGAK